MHIFAIVAAAFVLLAWQERKNKLILFGVISLSLFFGAGLAFDRHSRRVAAYVGLAGLALGFASLWVGMKRLIYFLRQKAKSKEKPDQLGIQIKGQ